MRAVAEEVAELQQNYRYWILWRAPQIRFLDFQKVKEAEREKAKELFGTVEAPTDLAQSIMAVRTNKPLSYNAPTTNGAGNAKKVKITEKEKKKFEALVKKAKTLADVQRLEKAYSEGRLPAGMGDEGDAMDET